MTNYQTGRRLEYRVRNMFRKQGYFVIRAAQSKPIDLVCIRDGKTVLIECKVGRSWLGPNRKLELLEIARQAGAPIIVARRRSNRKVDLSYLRNGKPFIVKTAALPSSEESGFSEGSLESMKLLKHGQPTENQVAIS